MAGHQPWDPNGYGAGGIKADEGRITIGSLEGFQTPEANNLPHAHVYPSHPGHPGHPGNQFDLQGQFPEGTAQSHGRYYENPHGFGGANTNGGGLHGHGHGQFEHPYQGSSFNVNPGYETGFSNREVHSQFVTEQPSRTHSHTPSAFSSQPWQGPPIQQFQSDFALNPVNYGHRNGDQTYQQNVSPYQGNNFFSPEVFSARNGQTGFRSQQAQPMLQSYQGHQTGGGTIMQFQPSPIGNVSETSDQIYSQHQQMQGIVPTPQAHPATAAATTVASQLTAVVGPPPSNDQLVAQEPDSSWENPDGCPFLLVRNPPPTRLGTYCDLNLRSTDKSYIAKNNLRTTALLPSRQGRLPCEILAELERLKKERDQALQPEKNKLEGQIAQLENEPVIVSTSKDLIPAAQAKVKASSKHQASNMDSTSKPKSLENVPEDEENATDATAREIKSSGRPSDALKAIEYDIINILWRDPKHPEFPHNLVVDKLHVFADYVINLWSKSKDLKSKVDDAKKKNDQAKATSLKADLDATYDTIRVAIEAAIMFGDRFTLTQIGIHTKFLGNLSILLRTLFVAEDYNGRLPKAILKLLSLFVTVEVEFLKERVKLDRVRQKFKDNLDEESTDYMDQIFDNAKKRSALKAEETREDVKKNDDGKKAIQGPKKPSSMSNKDPVIAPSSKTPLSKNDALSKKNNAEIKRPIDYSSLGSARKVSSTAAKSSPSLTASKRPGDDGVDSRVPKKLAVENAAGAPSSAKTSSNVTPAIPQSSSANAQSRSRPSGSMLPGRSRSSAKVQPKKPVARQPASSAIGGLLAEINSEKPKQVKEPERAPETPEETEIRLRKEAKRKLHVTWKPDGELTEIRILEHDTAEDKGRDDNMLRDARDNRSEGQVLRESVQREKEGVDDAEEDEAREKTNGIALRKWTEPIPYSPAQKSRISQKRQEEMFTSRGGLRPVESKQNKVMEEYESRELMAIYTSFSEVPATPRSPTGRIAEIVTQPKIRALPSGPTQWNESLPAMKYAEIHRRWSDNINFGREMALVNALHRLKASRGPMNLPNVAARGRTGWDASIGRDNGSEVLALLQSDKVKNYVDPDPFDPARPKTHRRHDYGDPKVQADIDALEDTFAMFIGKQAPPNQPPMLQANASQQYQQLVQPQHVQAQQAQPQAQQQLPPEYLEALQKINALSAGQALQPSVQPPVAPSFQPNPVAQQPFFAALLQQSVVPPPQPAQPAQPANTLQGLQGILDALKIAPAPAYATPHAVPNVATNAASHAAPQGYWPDWSQNQAQPQIQPQTSQAYTGYGHNNQSFGSQSQHNQPQATQGQHDSNDRGNRRDFRGNREQKNINRSLIGTKPCSFWAKGQCAKGSNCTFRHDPNDLQDQGQN